VRGFGARLSDAVSRCGPLCLGIDPHPELLRAWDLPVNPDGLAAFCEICMAAYADFAVVKFEFGFCRIYWNTDLKPWGAGWTVVAIAPTWEAAWAAQTAAVQNGKCK